MKTSLPYWIAAGMLLTGGCANQATVVHSENFQPALEDQSVNSIETGQRAAGARNDATLYPQHFDGPHLSSLGTAYLDNMLADSRSCDPLVVYVDIPDDANNADRRLAVAEYLETRGGLKPEQIVLNDGPNPGSYSPVEPNIKNYDRTDTSANGNGTGGGGSTTTGATQ